MKKFVIILIILIVTTIGACFIYFNSYNYRLRLAEEDRDNEIKKLNKINRQYIYEGVYSFDNVQLISQTIIDKFGERQIISTQKYLGEGEISFTSKRMIILFNNIKEEFLLGRPLLNDLNLNDSTTEYRLQIIQWNIIKVANNMAVFHYDTTYKNENYDRDSKMNLYAFYNGRPNISLVVQNIIKRNKVNESLTKISLDGLNYWKYEGCKLGGFLSADCNESIIIKDMKYKYNSIVPDYVKEAGFAHWKYDIESYFDQFPYLVKRKNPFLIKDRV